MSEPAVLPEEGDFWIEEGYSLRKLAGRLTYPSNLEFTPEGDLLVAEAGFSYPYIKTTASISRILRDGSQELIAEGFEPPLIGMKWHDGALLVTHRGALSRVTLEGHREDLITGIPSRGDHHTNHLLVREGKVYFGQGSYTNAGIVGIDNLLPYGWLAVDRQGHDLPPYDTRLTGLNFEMRDPFNPFKTIHTGAFLPIGTPSSKGQVIQGESKPTSVIYRCNPDGSELEVFAWGLRNPYALKQAPDGRLFTISQGGDKRGSRPIESPDVMYEIVQDGWYGFPDFFAGRPATAPEYNEGNEDPIGFVMDEHPQREEPFFLFPTHAAAVDLEFARSERFGFVGQAFVAEMGSGAPITTGGKLNKAGFKVTRLDMRSRDYVDFYRNENPGFGGSGADRPVALRFSPDGERLLVLDYGILGIPATGKLWEIKRS